MKKFLILTFTILTLIAPSSSYGIEITNFNNVGSISSCEVRSTVVCLDVSDLSQDTNYYLVLYKNNGEVESYHSPIYKYSLVSGSTYIPNLDVSTYYRAILYVESISYENGFAPSSYVDFTTTKRQPKITNISPTLGPVNTEVVISGEDFYSIQRILFNRTFAENYTFVSPTKIIVKVPPNFTEGPITLGWVENGVDKSIVSSQIFTQPKIYFNLAEGKVNDVIKIQGDRDISGSEVVIFSENKNAIPPDNSPIYSVDVAIPEGAITGKVSIKTPKYGVITSSTDFTITPVIGIGNTGGVPPTPPDIGTTTYKVVSGDTLGGIATKFNTTIAKLKELNSGKIVNENKIEVGWILTVPNTRAAIPAITFDGKSLVPTCNTGVVDEEGNYSDKCDFNMIMALVNKVISFCLIYLATPLFALIMIYVGYLYLTASGSSENINLAKKILKNALFGYVIALAAWLVVKSVLSTLGVIGIDKYIQ